MLVKQNAIWAFKSKLMNCFSLECLLWRLVYPASSISSNSNTFNKSIPKSIYINKNALPWGVLLVVAVLLMC